MIDIKNVKFIAEDDECLVYEMEKGGKIVCVCFIFENECLMGIEIVEKKEGGEFGGYGLTGEEVEDVFSSEEVECLWCLDVLGDCN